MVEMKKSGVEWIGEIPQHWNLKPLKHLISITGGGTPNTESAEYWDGDIPWVSPKDMKSDRISATEDYITEKGLKESTSNLIDPGALLIVFRSGILQRTIPVAINTVPVSINQDIKSLTSVDPNFYIRFLFWFIKGNESHLLLEWSKKGVTVESLETDYLRTTIQPLPPLDEQRLISRYLDKKTQQIDTLIEKIEKKIELLKEQRTSLINHYVTKGLDPNVEMKDSGVEWIGKIPKHWEVTKLKWLVEIETGRDPAAIYSDDGPYEVLGTGGVIGRTHSFMWDEDSLILGRKGTIDKPFLQKSPFWISDVVYYTKPTLHLTVDYIWYLFTQIDFSYYKYGSTLPSMSKDEYGNMKFPVPPDDEYFAIASKLESIWKRIEHLVSLYKNKIDKLSEYRQSLISSVVTGKVRVTEDMV